jgi:hypothetical protein
MSRISNIRLIETWYHRMWNRWDKSAFEEILTPDIAFRGSLGQVKHGRRNLRVHGFRPRCVSGLHEPN